MRYDFSPGDFETALGMLRMTLDQSVRVVSVADTPNGPSPLPGAGPGGEGNVPLGGPAGLVVPWQALTYITGEVRGLKLGR